MTTRSTSEDGEIANAGNAPRWSQAIRQLRLEKGLSLRALSTLSGLPFSTLSKLENGKMALTYDKLIRLTQALNVDIRDILADTVPRASTVAVGRRSVTRAGEAVDAVSQKHVHYYPAADLLGKMMTPIIIDIQARSVEELGGLVRHGGEEYLYVLRGSMQLHSDIYAPLALGPGDSVYFDSGMSHGYVRTSTDPCVILCVCAGEGIQQLAETASKRLRLSEEHTARSA